jgi:hypothetical protein
MKRLYLAAGPWMMNGNDMAIRIVLYKNFKGEFVVHNQTYQAGATKFAISFSSGDYFGKTETDYRTAMLRWEHRNKLHTTNEDYLGHLAPSDFAHDANCADIAEQYDNRPDKPAADDEPWTMQDILRNAG